MCGAGSPVAPATDGMMILMTMHNDDDNGISQQYIYFAFIDVYFNVSWYIFSMENK